MMYMKREMIAVAHNIRSCHNVGSLFRTAECLGVTKLICSGYTPYPRAEHDERLPHIIEQNQKRIHKTALGAEKLIPWQQAADITNLINHYRKQGYKIIALEQAKNSQKLSTFVPTRKNLLILGNERDGLDDSVLQLCDTIVEIPMQGQKESLNVTQAAAIAFYSLREA